MKEISGVYSITNIKNKKRYIGSAVNIERRWMQHRSELRGGYHRSRYLQRAWKKYGEDAFRFEILATCDPDDLIAQEQFFIKDEPGMVLRTHTSPVQVRYMETQMKKGITPPYRIIVPGRAFRNEATDMTHEAEFFQIEGLAVGEDVTLGHLKGTLEQFFKELFKGAQVEIRFRPSFFPFVEPGVEVDMRLVGNAVPEKLRDRWIEIMGAGMVHPNVLKNAGIDPEKYRGFAFGMGLDRLALLRWSIDDVRLMHSADLRFINQF
jgi:phenylalanyl-tRNA synthetase alpha chain